MDVNCSCFFPRCYDRTHGHGPGPNSRTHCLNRHVGWETARKSVHILTSNTRCVTDLKNKHVYI